MDIVLALETWKAFSFYKSFLTWYCTWYQPTYLEVGCLGGDLCSSLSTRRAVGIDVNEHPDWPLYVQRASHPTEFLTIDSDTYFATHEDKFGLIFIDGDHHEAQVRKDVENALLHLEDGGLIAMHDTLPPVRSDTSEEYCGTAYKVAIELRQRRTELEVYTFPVTFGLTLVGKIGKEFPWVV